jgi:hypothetical protein
LWSRSEQKYAKIPPPLSATTKLDFGFTRPGPKTDICRNTVFVGHRNKIVTVTPPTCFLLRSPKTAANTTTSTKSLCYGVALFGETFSSPTRVNVTCYGYRGCQCYGCVVKKYTRSRLKAPCSHAACSHQARPHGREQEACLLPFPHGIGHEARRMRTLTTSGQPLAWATTAAVDHSMTSRPGVAVAQHSLG